MAKQSPSLYSISKTFVWFAVTSLLLTGSLVAIVLLDHQREWKVWQKKFNALKLEKAQAELKTASQAVDAKRSAELQKTLAEAEKAVASQKTSREQALKGAAKTQLELDRVKADYQNLKQYEDSYKYYLEEYRLHKDPKAKDMEARLNDVSPRVQALRVRQEELEKAKEEADNRAAAFLEEGRAAQRELDKLLEEKNRLEKRIEKIRPSLVKDVLNAPMLDFIAPSLQVQQIVLEDLQDDYHFTKVQKVDRCTTCHLGIDQKGFEDAPQPFRTHPALDLYLSASSKHPIDKVGCTSCHGGSGQAVSFVESAHTPRDEAQKKQWEKTHRWREFEHWENKMLPLQHVEASCVKCHQGAALIPQADRLNKGRKLAEGFGCFNCHKVKGFEDAWKPGPDLSRVKEKLSPEWVAKWLDNPRDFRPSTQMPRVFHLSNLSGAEDRAKNDAAIQGIVAYLMSHSAASRAPAAGAPPAGDKAKGEQLVKTLGCLGCHSAPGLPGGDFAPELSGLGSKVSAEWLFAWVKNPKHFSPDTRMPDLRLSDSEAGDITAYLLSLKNPEFEQKAAPKADPAVVDRMILESLRGTLRQSEAQAQLDKMDAAGRMEFLGQRTIGHQGCYACHSIPGFEGAKPIGAELSDEGRKDVHKFDFGFTDIEKTRDAWIEQKLKDPRIFDQGKIRSYYEKLRMPQFNLTDKEIGALTTFVLSLTEEQVPLQSQRRLDLPQERIEKGRRLVAKLNCQGCHTLDGTEGTLRTLTEDAGAAPPPLDGEGAKVHEEWLHDFLKEPSTIRPWLTYRMPTFGLSEEELQTLVYYFHHLAGQEIRFGEPATPAADAESLKAGQTLFDAFQCIKCHQITPEAAAMGSSFLAPDLTLTKTRLKPDWVNQWMRDPQQVQAGTMMPTFFADGQSPMPDLLGGDAEKQITAIRDYLYRYEKDSPVEK